MEATIDGLDIARQSRKALEVKKGGDIVVYDVRKVSTITDYIVIASGASRPQLKALMDEVQHQLKGLGVPSYRRSGTADCGWVVLDYVDAVVHVFLDELRRHYAIEELWAGAPQVK